eukprot:5510881-Amphidinium_carterae.1
MRTTALQSIYTSSKLHTLTSWEAKKSTEINYAGKGLGKRGTSSVTFRMAPARVLYIDCSPKPKIMMNALTS